MEDAKAQWNALQQAKATASEPTVKVSPVESVKPSVPKSVILESGGARPVAPSLPIGGIWALILSIWARYNPDAVKEVGEKSLEVATKAYEAYPDPGDPTSGFINKVLKSGGEPGPGIIFLMERHGYSYEGMVDGHPKWGQLDKQPTRAVRFR